MKNNSKIVVVTWVQFLAWEVVEKQHMALRLKIKPGERHKLKRWREVTTKVSAFSGREPRVSNSFLHLLLIQLTNMWPSLISTNSVNMYKILSWATWNKTLPKIIVQKVSIDIIRHSLEISTQWVRKMKSEKWRSNIRSIRNYSTEVRDHIFQRIITHKMIMFSGVPRDLIKLIPRLSCICKVLPVMEEWCISLITLSDSQRRRDLIKILMNLLRKSNTVWSAQVKH